MNQPWTWSLIYLNRRDVRERESLVAFVCIICYSCVVETRQEHYAAQNCKEYPYIIQSKQRYDDIKQKKKDVRIKTYQTKLC